MLAALALAAVLPTISISVHASPDVSPRLVKWTFEEADAIWRDAGVRIRWTLEHENEAAAPDRGDRLRSDQIGRYGTTISNQPGTGNVVIVDLRKELPAPAGGPGN